MDNAIKKCNNISNGGYTCNILSLQESIDFNKKTKLRSKYSYVFGFQSNTVPHMLNGFANYNEVKQVRLNCLELFKAITLKSKGYENL